MGDPDDSHWAESSESAIGVVRPTWAESSVSASCLGELHGPNRPSLHAVDYFMRRLHLLCYY